MSGLFGELKRRNVFRVAAIYAISAWLLLQVADIVFPVLSIPEWGMRLLLVLLVFGLLVTVIAAWAYELTPDGSGVTRI